MEPKRPYTKPDDERSLKMASWNTPNLRVRLSNEARGKVGQQWVGNRKHGGEEPHIGMTRVHLEQGLLYAEVNWGIDGVDVPISPDVDPDVESFDLQHTIDTERAGGIYILCKGNDRNRVLAKALVISCGKEGEKSDIRVDGKNRKDVVRLFELICSGKIRPDVEHEEFKQVEGNLGELRRLRRRVPSLQRQIETLGETITSLNEQLANVRAELTKAQTAAETN